MAGPNDWNKSLQEASRAVWRVKSSSSGDTILNSSELGMVPPELG